MTFSKKNPELGLMDIWFWSYIKLIRIMVMEIIRKFLVSSRR